VHAQQISTSGCVRVAGPTDRGSGPPGSRAACQRPSVGFGRQQACACFGYRWYACERWSFLATGVTPMILRPLITVGNLGAWSCLDIV
jgi:hypothetical protein